MQHAIMRAHRGSPLRLCHRDMHALEMMISGKSVPRDTNIGPIENEEIPHGFDLEMI